jgi:hypothetical protein
MRVGSSSARIEAYRRQADFAELFGMSDRVKAVKPCVMGRRPDVSPAPMANPCRAAE